jgi:hypothetical protein
VTPESFLLRRRRLFAGVAIYFVCAPLAPLIFNA